MGTNAGSDRVGHMRLSPVIGRAWAALLVVAGMALAGCGASDGSVGVGTGQQPDPVAPDFAIAYTKGPLLDEDMELQQPTDLRDLDRFNVGTDLFIRDRASPAAAERNVTFGETDGQGDVMGVDVSVDGTKVLFAMRGPFDPNLDDEDQPTWNIWEYELPTQTLRRIIQSDITAEAGKISRRTTWPTAGSSSPRRGSGRAKRSFSTRASRSSRPGMRTATIRRMCCT